MPRQPPAIDALPNTVSSYINLLKSPMDKPTTATIDDCNIENNNNDPPDAAAADDDDSCASFSSEEDYC